MRSSREKVPGDPEMAPYAYFPSPLVAAPAAYVAFRIRRVAAQSG